jgi:hypothetical protein
VVDSVTGKLARAWIVRENVRECQIKELFLFRAQLVYCITIGDYYGQMNFNRFLK